MVRNCLCLAAVVAVGGVISLLAQIVLKTPVIVEYHLQQSKTICLHYPKDVNCYHSQTNFWFLLDVLLKHIDDKQVHVELHHLVSYALVVYNDQRKHVKPLFHPFPLLLVTWQAFKFSTENLYYFWTYLRDHE